LRTDIFVVITAALSDIFSRSSSQIGHGPRSNHCRNKKPYDHTIHRALDHHLHAIKVRYCREKAVEEEGAAASKGNLLPLLLGLA
jgi:hypothetical protein